MKRSKRFASLACAACICTSLVMTGCSSATPAASSATAPAKSETAKQTEPTPTPTPAVDYVAVTPEEYGNENLQKIADEIQQTLTVPDEYTAQTSEEIRGTVETVTYDTRAYAYEEYFADDLNSAELPVEKTMYVYLPAGYSEDQEYSTLYLIPGGSEVAEYWFSMETEEDDNGPVGEGFLVRLLDNMIAQGTIEPLIVVSPGLYVETAGYHAYDKGGLNRRYPEGTEKNDPATVCSSINTAWTDNFAKELRNDIIPVIDSRYSTYADRAHRGIGGTSMGSMTTLRSGLWQCNDLFAWYAPMSSGVTSSRSRNEVYAQTEMVWDDLTKDGADPNISMLLNFNGSEDMAHDPHVLCMNHLLEYSAGKLVNGTNYCFFDIDGFDHNFDAWKYDLYLTLQVFFK